MAQNQVPGQLGNGSRTIKSAGCFLTSMAMAASAHGFQGGVADANRIVKNAGGFSGSNLYADRGAKALGMNLDSRQATRDPNVLRNALKSGPAVVGVDYKGGSSSAFSSADHFVVVNGYDAASRTFHGIDAANGRAIQFNEAMRQIGGKGYNITEVLKLSGR